MPRSIGLVSIYWEPSLLVTMYSFAISKLVRTVWPSTAGWTMTEPILPSLMSIRIMPSWISCGGIIAWAMRLCFAYASWIAVVTSFKSLKAISLLVQGLTTACSCASESNVLPLNLNPLIAIFCSLGLDGLRTAGFSGWTCSCGAERSICNCNSRCKAPASCADALSDAKALVSTRAVLLRATRRKQKWDDIKDIGWVNF